MFALRKAAQLYNRMGSRSKSQFIGSGICGMPRNRITQREKILLTLCLFGFWFPYPAWVLWNGEYYKNPYGA